MSNAPVTRRVLEAYFFSEDESEEGIRLRELTREERGPYFHLDARDEIDDYVVAYVISGEGEVAFSGDTWKLEPGAVLVRDLREPFSLWTSGESTLTMLRVSYAGNEAGKWNERCLRSLRGAWRLSNSDAIFSSFQSIFEECKQGGVHRDEICLMLLKTLFLKVAEGSVIRSQAEWRAHETFSRCREYLKEHYMKTDSAEEAAASAGVSHTHMCRLFKRFWGTSPHSYLLKLRMADASQVLLEGDTKLEDLAIRYGYSDPFSFSKAFKRATGLSPQMFRDAHSL
ncbi:AraC family transcriptional regulator [Pelagicoccus mobilis]|uniref:Helix-turn-helix domain-containing protein n=1 Tax=Pelagicoccus mobilis TaxID=415221 RepID=A0A934VP69_9BACT|nr:AraC family transcriptional regulator [Pelagicoccus mobilis]MBK1875510.1 helix-turn-helix domain-containing protein [Pelagicoccus mobilis]